MVTVDAAPGARIQSEGRRDRGRATPVYTAGPVAEHEEKRAGRRAATVGDVAPGAREFTWLTKRPPWTYAVDQGGSVSDPAIEATALTSRQRVDAACIGVPRIGGVTVSARGLHVKYLFYRKSTGGPPGRQELFLAGKPRGGSRDMKDPPANGNGRVEAEPIEQHGSGAVRTFCAPEQTAGRAAGSPPSRAQEPCPGASRP